MATLDCPEAMGPHDPTKDCLQRQRQGPATSGMGRSEMAVSAGPTLNGRARGRGQGGQTWPGGLAALCLHCVPLTPSDIVCRTGAYGEHGSLKGSIFC